MPDNDPDEQEEFACIINIEAKIVPTQIVSFTEVVRLAFPHKADDPNVTFKVTYRKAAAPSHEGVMVSTDHVTIQKDGKTSFTVVHATKS